MSSEAIEYNPFSYEIHENPYPTYKRLRESAPAYYNEEHDFWALSRFDDIWNAFTDWQTFSSANGVSLEDTAAFSPDMIITLDPPRQAKIRGLVALALTPRRVADLEPKIRTIVTRHIDRFIDEGAADMITDLGQLLPMEVIAAFVGVPDEDQAQIQGWTEEMLHREPDSSEVPEAGVKAFGALDDYFRRDLSRRRGGGERRGSGGDDLVSGLLTAEVDGERLSDDEIVGFLFLLALAGGETTTKLIGNMTYNLCRHPDQKAKLLADRSLMAKAVEEVRKNASMIAGTPYFMSPEQSAGQVVDHRSDLYSLGVTLYQLITGTVPFPDGDVTYHHRHTPAPDPREHKEETPEALARLLLRLLAKDPDERYQSSQDLAEELRQIAQVLA